MMRKQMDMMLTPLQCLQCTEEISDGNKSFALCDGALLIAKPWSAIISITNEQADLRASRSMPCRRINIGYENVINRDASPPREGRGNHAAPDRRCDPASHPPLLHTSGSLPDRTHSAPA